MAIKRWGTGVALATTIIWFGGVGDSARACGPFIAELVMTNAVYPASAASFSRGELGIVQPRYARRFLVLAYRRFGGVAPSGVDPDPLATRTDSYGDSAAQAEWQKALASLPGKMAPDAVTGSERITADRSSFTNCPDDAFATAAATLQQRVKQFGATSNGVRQWAVAQQAVFSNCEGGDTSTLVLPSPTTTGLDPIFVADRAYQTAAAHFYGTDYVGAERLFRAIGTDAGSPWRTWGRYLASRALIRRALVVATTPEESARLLGQAKTELDAILGDASLSSVHAAARASHDWVEVHLHPVDHLRATGQRLASAASPTSQDYIDYTTLMDRLVGDSVTYAYDSVAERDAMSRDPLTDWVMAMQGVGPMGQARAVTQWRATHKLPWLVAAMWRVDPAAADAPAMLTEAAAVPASSPAFATLAYLRTRLLIERGDLAGARALLASLPDAPAAGFPLDAINLMRSLRFRAASSLDEMLAAAPRMPVAAGQTFWEAATESAPGPFTRPAFDVDAAVTFTERLPLERLVDAVRANRLPARLRTKVAIAAWTRAVQLKDDAAGLAVAPILKTLAPDLTADLNAYINATSPDARHAAGILLLLRWPGMRNHVALAEEAGAYAAAGPRDDIAKDAIGVNWWCGIEPALGRPAGPYEWWKEMPVSSLPNVNGTTTQAASPVFLSADDRTAMTAEWQRLTRLKSAPTYLATEAVAWAETRPRDPGVAEALARAVVATHYGCGDEQTGAASKRAFTILHARYATTTWAKQTPFWYEGR